jgi:hypothetical protein
LQRDDVILLQQRAGFRLMRGTLRGEWMASGRRGSQ